MAGQDIKRRELLRAIGIAAIASHYPGFVKWAYAGAHDHASNEPTRNMKLLPTNGCNRSATGQ